MRALTPLVVLLESSVAGVRRSSGRRRASTRRLALARLPGAEPVLGEGDRRLPPAGSVSSSVSHPALSTLPGAGPLRGVTWSQAELDPWRGLRGPARRCAFEVLTFPSSGGFSLATCLRAGTTWRPWRPDRDRRGAPGPCRTSVNAGAPVLDSADFALSFAPLSTSRRWSIFHCPWHPLPARRTVHKALILDRDRGDLRLLKRVPTDLAVWVRPVTGANRGSRDLGWKGLPSHRG